APEFPAYVRPIEVRSPWFRLQWMRWAAAGVFATAFVLALVLFFQPWQPVPIAPTGWDVTSVSGSPRIAGKTLAAAQSRNLGLGQLLEPESGSKATIAIADTGAIEVEPGARVRFLESGSGRKRLKLERGTIHATIWAPPGEFVVDTPAAVAVDLGCVY